MANDDNYGEQEHPALKNFSRTGFMIKHVAGKVLKWGAIGAVAVGGIAAIPAMGVSGLGGVASMITGIFSKDAAGWVAGKSMGVTYSAFTSGAWLGGTLAAASGGLLSLSGASQAADEEQERLIAVYERAEARGRQQDAIAIQRQRQLVQLRQQGKAMGFDDNLASVNSGLPLNVGQNMGRNA